MDKYQKIPTLTKKENLQAKEKLTLKMDNYKVSENMTMVK